MYSIIQNIIGFSAGTSYSDQSTILSVCGVMVLILTVVTIDIIRDIFSACCRG